MMRNSNSVLQAVEDVLNWELPTVALGAAVSARVQALQRVAPD